MTMRVIWVVVFTVCSSLYLSSPADASILVNGGFETVEPIGTFWPNQFGDWNGDGGSVVTAESGITPREGQRMLRFDYAAPSRFGATNLGASQVEQLIDASQFGDLSSGNVMITASAWFNRIAGDAQTDTQFAMTLAARTGSPATYPSDKESTNGFLDGEIAYLIADANPDTWEKLSLSLVLPSNTSFVSLELIAIENVFNDFSGVEYDGHYADQASVSVLGAVPEPSSYLMWSLMGMVAIALAWRKKVATDECYEEKLIEIGVMRRVGEQQLM